MGLDPTELATAPATAQLAALDVGEVTSRELLEIFLDRIERLGGPVNAVVTLDADGARRACDRADAQRRKGIRIGPLHGLPMTIKDAIEVGGLRSTGGAAELAEHVPEHDAPAVAALRAAGAVVFGKTNAPAWSADLQTHNEVFGLTRNPWDLTRTAGGSSGGSAVAVGCGLAGLELGTDIGGSIRIPSHCCGVYGLKPTYGIVPQRGYLDHVGGGGIDPDLNVFGPIARHPDDLELALSVLAGPGPDQQPAWQLTLPPPSRLDPARYRVGYWFAEPSGPIDDDVRSVLLAGITALADAGGSICESHPPVDFAEQVGLFGQLLTAAVAPSLPSEAGDVLAGTHRNWLVATEHRSRLRRIWAEWFGEFDLLLCPVLGVPAFHHDLDRPIVERTVGIGGQPVTHPQLIGWLGLIGVLGLPAVVAPVGTTPAGLPVGVQIVAPWYRDRDALHLARHLAELIGGYQVPPGFASDHGTGI